MKNDLNQIQRSALNNLVELSACNYNIAIRVATLLIFAVK